jgi:hypothetical protein
MTQATIITWVPWPDPTAGDPVPATGHRAQVELHEIWEVISPDSYRYYDKTEQHWITDWERNNSDGFIPIVEIFNEYDSTLSGGQSDLESVHPFITAFHEVLRQSLQAHRYHSIPKLKFKVRDITSFLRIMRAEQGVSAAGDKKILAFEKKIERKRVNFQPFIQRLIKMHLSMNGRSPATVEIIWDEIRTENIVALAQALQQTVMSLEVLLERKIISDNTAREALSMFRIFRRMKSTNLEAKDAEKNISMGKIMADEEIRVAKETPQLNGGGTPSDRKALTSGSNSGGKNN